MNKSWQLRDALYQFFHNWPLLAACFLLGSLIGWFAGSVWPPYYKATREVSVALNPYRTYSDARFLALAKPRYANIDNYHYWQMNQLDALLYHDDILAATHNRLEKEDAFWKARPASELRAMLDADWRTAGIWKLSAAHPDRERALQLARAWSETAVAAASESAAAARELISIDADLAAVRADLQSLEARLSALRLAEAALRTWNETAAGLPREQPLPVDLRWQLYALTTALAAPDPAWDALLESQPAIDAPAAEFLTWNQAVLGIFQGEIKMLPGRAQALEARRSEMESAYNSAAERSRGLSPNLDVQSLGEPESQAVRPRATLALIGGFLGILAAVLNALVRLTLQKPEGGELRAPNSR